MSHLMDLIESKSKDKHYLTKSDLYSKGKMNYESAKKMSDDKVLGLLETMPNTKGTSMYLRLMNYLIVALIDPTADFNTKIYKIWYCVFICRFWKHWIKENSQYSLKDNFLTLNTYTCIELNGHMLIKLITIFRSNKDLTSDMFCPWVFNSQQCESLFRAARSMTSTFSTVINFSIKDFLNRIDRISFINYVVNDLKDSYVFPRENKRNISTNFYKLTEEELEKVNIKETVNRALDNAFQEIKELGIVVDIGVGSGLDIKFTTDSICEEETE